MSRLPTEAERLLVVAPADFVAERNHLADELRGAGRSDEAAAVGELRKPSPVVLAVNRAARARPKAAEAASVAAVELRKAQVGDDPEALKSALDELQQSLELLAEVAISHVAPPDRRAGDAMRRRVYDLLRSAVADDEARQALVRGVLTTEVEATGFTAFAGVAPTRRTRDVRRASGTRAKDDMKRERRRALRGELARAEEDLAAAERSVREAEKIRTKAEKEVASIRARLERL